LATTFNGMFGRLELAFQRLEESVEDQRRFTSDASHELRTPLTTIKANVSWALRKNRPETEYREALAAADEAADRMNRIVEDLLCLARSDGGRLQIKKERLAVKPLLESSLSESLSGPGCDLTSLACVEVLPMDRDICVHGDEYHLKRVFVNLIENA